MKQIIITLAIFLAIPFLGFTQVPDTLRYLQQLVSRKQEFVGYPFAKLEDSLAISIRRFTPMNKTHNNKEIENCVDFRFIYNINPNDIVFTYPWLVVVWETPPQIQHSLQIYRSNNKGEYNSTASQYYRPLIVKNIYLIE